MSFLRDILGRDGAQDYDPGPWADGMARVVGGRGGVMDADQAMRLSAVYACLRLLSEAIATMPLDTFVRSAGTRQSYRPKPDYLSFQPPQCSRIDYLSQRHAVAADGRQRLRRYPA